MKKELWENSEVVYTKVTWYKGFRVITLTLKDRTLYFSYRRKIQRTGHIIRKIYLNTKTDEIKIVYMNTTTWNYLDRIKYFIDGSSALLVTACKNNLLE